MSTITVSGGNGLAVVPLVFVDTETTSLRRPYRPAGRRIWEVGMIRREPDGQRREASILVADVDLRDADPFSLKIGRFHQRHPLGAEQHLHAGDPGAQYWTEEQAARLVAQDTYGAHLIGAVPTFEDLGLEDMLYRHGLSPGWHYHLVDVEALAAGKLGMEPPWDSDELFAKLGVEVPEGDRHTALGDARGAELTYDAVMSA